MTCELCADSRYHPPLLHSDCDCDCNQPRREGGVPPGFMNMPRPFTGSSAELKANLETHSFGPPEGRCWNCDVRRGGGASAYPCGVQEPRVLVRNGSSEADAAVMTTVIAAALGGPSET